MTRALRVVCRPDVAAGFALAGLQPIEPASLEGGIEVVRDLITRPDVGVALVQDVFYDALPEEMRRQLGRRPLPLVVPFPSPMWGQRATAAEAYIVELLRQVIGYRVRLK
jgi:vacuolar-type H+-ATPase subunit F/Vma7